jgi:hypothetical protein
MTAMVMNPSGIPVTWIVAYAVVTTPAMTVSGAAADMTKKTTDGTPSLSLESELRESEPWMADMRGLRGLSFTAGGGMVTFGAECQ